MPILFSDAYAVVAWIGTEQDNSPIIMDILKNLDGPMNKNARSDEILTSIPVQAWKALAYLLQRPYWRRMWIVQEVTLAGEQTVLLCGSRSARLQSLWKLIVAIIENAPLCHRLFAASLGEGGNSYYDIFRHDTFSVCARLFYFRDIDKSLREGTECDVLQLLDVCRGSLQQDDRDKVYGILGLLPPKVSALIEPDLNKTAHNVYVDLSCAIIRAMKRLDLLQNCRLDKAQQRFPTWTPDLLVNSMSHAIGSRTTIDAGGDLEFEPVFSPDGLMVCRGVILDEIDHLTPSQWPLAVVSEEEASESLSGASMPKQNKATVRDALWRTLVGGNAGFPHKAPAPACYAQLLELPWPDSSDEDVHTMAQDLIDEKLVQCR